MACRGHDPDVQYAKAILDRLKAFEFIENGATWIHGWTYEHRAA